MNLESNKKKRRDAKKAMFGAIKHGLWTVVLSLTGVIGAVHAFPVVVTADFSATSIIQAQQATLQTSIQMAQAQQAVQQTAIQTAAAVDAKQSHIEQYLEYIKEAERWTEKVQQYSNLVTQNIQRFTSLRGILTTVEKNLGLSDDTLKAMSDIGRAIRATLSLKNQFVGLIHSELAMVESLEQRARNGIFDPQADLNDLEDYLKRTMGREARAVLLTRQRLARVNPELAKLTEEWQRVRARRIGAEKEKKELEDKLRDETSLSDSTRQVSVGEDGSSSSQTGRVSTSGDAVNGIITRIGQLELLINDLLRQERELEEKIQKIYAQAHARFDDVYFTGEKWTEYMDGWSALQEAKNQAITGLIDSYGTRPRIVPSPSPTN